ncbi:MULTISPECIES: GGDEF domain-containing protein [Vibrio]|uniref:Diguanylate cyclase n=2 Tax=Vibrio TaxID=662 RepID=A0A7X4RWF2_9VIBR|nr:MULTISPECIES: GGDEF domain-containing protein [Vibrio]MBF9000862.1 GGDEF domain-containing protein [Vibrio nitrifigilis]MZI95320.1 diguanylate cyclase [Vibrio eleionomae]
MYSNQSNMVNANTQTMASIFDPLTDLYNRHLFLQVSNSLLKISLRQRMPVSVAMVSLEHVSDTAHLEIDEAQEIIKQSADLLKSITRDSDTLSHFDDYVFGLLLYNCTYQQSHIVANRINAKLEGRLSFRNQPVTIAIGLAEFDRNFADNQHLSEHMVEEALSDMGRR